MVTLNRLLHLDCCYTPMEFPTVPKDRYNPLQTDIQYYGSHPHPVTQSKPDVSLCFGILVVRHIENVSAVPLVIKLVFVSLLMMRSATKLSKEFKIRITYLMAQTVMLSTRLAS